MNAITQATIIFLSIGVASGCLILYDYLASPHVISKEQAIEIALKSGGWTPQKLGNDTIEAELLQAKFSNRIALVINPTTVSPDPSEKIEPLRAGYVKNDQLFWEVVIKKQVGQDGFKEWIYEIDATNGTRIESIG